MKIIRYSFAFTLFFLLALPAMAQEQVSGFDVSITIEPSGSLLVTEDITYDFGAAERHGIYRLIPVKYRSAYGKYSIQLRDVQVYDSAGAALPFRLERDGSDQRIRIGDPDVLISGQHEYRIQYRVERAINFAKEYDELYWNVTGNGWDVALDDVRAEVSLPGSVDADMVTSRCFAGSFGSTTSCDSQNFTGTFTFTESALAPGEGLTIVQQFPKGIVTAPTTGQIAMQVAKDNGMVAAPILAFVIMYWLWHTRGRDPKGRGIIIAEYDPPDGLTPAEIGTVIDEVTGNTDITAEIIYLAIKGYIRIKQETVDRVLKDSTDYVFQQLKPVDASLATYQQTLLNGFFESHGGPSEQPGVLREVRLSALKEKFATTFGTVKSQAMASVVKKGYFQGNPTTPKILYTLLGIGIGVLGVFLSQGSILSIASSLVAGLIVVGFGMLMAKRSEHGVLTKEHILGLKEYLQVAEADRLKFHNAPEKRPEVFERLLPYAIVLGVEKQWADQFKDLAMPEPRWFQGAYPGQFNSAVFASSLNSLASKTNTTLTSSPSSGARGGGFSGGGFGGGGGGSW